MEQDKKSDIGIVEIAAVFILAPIVLGTAITAASYIVCGIHNVFGKILFNRKMNRLVKEGKVVQINGEFYNLEEILEEKE